MSTTTAPARLSSLQRAGVSTVAARDIAERRTMATFVGAGIGVFALGMAPLFNSIEQLLADAMALFPEEMTAVIGGVDMATPAGWLNAEIFSVTAPAAILAMAIIIGARTVGGEEEAGTLHPLLGTPVSRTRVAVEKLLAMAVLVAIARALVFVGTIVGDALAGTDIVWSAIAAVAAHLALFGIAFGAIATAVGAAVGRYKLSAVATGVLAALAWVTATFLPLSDRIADAAKASPWYYYASTAPIANGFAWGHLAALAGIAVRRCHPDHRHLQPA
ncbi:MAG: ABC transporter permease subunit [Actinobacteria bacterium]|nr:ABC transporter permease subunit [Actinomycetota bacterium]